MNRLLSLLFCMLLFVTANAQSNYAQAMQQGDEAFNRQEYKKAINKYFAAEAFDPTKKDQVKEKVNKTFDKIEALRAEAIRSKKEAEKQKERAETALQEAKNQTKIAQANYLISEAKGLEETDPTLALRLAEQAMISNNNTFIEQTALNIYSRNIFYKKIAKLTAVNNGKYDYNFAGTITADKKYFIFGDSVGIHVVNVLTNEEKINKIPVGEDDIIDFSGDGKIVIGKKSGNNVNISSYSMGGERLREFTTDSSFLIKFSPDGNHIITYNQKGTFKFMGLDGTLIKELRINNLSSLGGFTVSNSGFLIFTYTISGSSVTPGKMNWEFDLNLWNERGEKITRFKNNTLKVFNKALFLPNDNILLSNDDHTLSVLDLDGNITSQLCGHDGEILAMTISDDQKYILTCAADNTIREWELRESSRYENGLGWIDEPLIKFSPDGSHYFVNFGSGDSLFSRYKGYADENIIQENVEVPEPEKIAGNEQILLKTPPVDAPHFVRSDKRIQSFCYLPGNKTVLAGIKGETYKCMDLNGKLITDLKIPWSEEIRAIAFSADKKYILILSMESANLWDAKNGFLIKEYQDIFHADMTWFSPNGKYILIKMNEGGKMLYIPMALEKFLKKNKIATLTLEQKKKYGITE